MNPSKRSIFLFVLVLCTLNTNHLTNAAGVSAQLGATACPHVTSSDSIRLSRGGSSSGNSNLLTTLQSSLDNFRQIIQDSRQHLIAAAVARATSIFAMYPVDTIKTRMQLRQPLEFQGLFRGVQGSLIGQVPYGVLTFGSYEMYKKSLLEKFPNVQPVMLYALSAILGDITGSGWLCPSEVVKQQMQGGMYDTTMDAVRGIWNKAGLRGFYQGYVGGLARDVPFRVAQLTSYEVTKNLYLRAKAQRRRNQALAEGKSTRKSKGPLVVPKEQLSPIESAVCGAIAGTFSAAVTAPLDRIKTLLMTESGAAYGGSVLTCAGKILAEEGVQGLFAGIVPRVTYIAPSVVIFFTVYEQVQQRVSKNE